jgi:hypothetical protein
MEMANLDRQMEREEASLDEALAQGRISKAQYREEMRQLQRDYREAALEAAQDAYERELDNW